MKKIFYYLLILLGFIFAFINVDKINTLAVTNIENTFGTYPVAIDVENYGSNLVNFNDVDFRANSTNIIKTNENENLKLTFDSPGNAYYIGTYFNLGKYITSGNTYNFSINVNMNRSGTIRFGLETQACNIYVNANIDTKLNCNFVAPENVYSAFVIYLYSNNIDNTGVVINVNDMMLLNGSVAPEFYSSKLYFGYELDIVFNDINYSTGINTEVKINGETCFNKSLSFAVEIGENIYGRENVCFIPFEINNFGYITLKETNIKTYFSKSGLVFSSESGYILTPILKGYYKGEYVENIIYLKNSYNVNSFYFNGFNVKVGGNNDSNINTIAIRPYENINPGNNLFPISTEITSYNFISEYVSDVIFTNQININEFLNIQFALTFGNYTNVSDINKLTYTISLSGINSIIRNEIGTNSPIPNNPNTIDRYNKCSAWYDIPCQLGNAVTYVIYEAPIISPVLTFIVSFVTMFSSLVSFVDLFNSFGIVFCCFIIYMFIELLHKYTK